MKTIEIPLTKGKTALVREVDAERVSRHIWCAVPRGKNWYAQSRFGGRLHYLHRFLLDEPETGVDHEDGNGLNNCRENLRLCDQSQNGANSRKQEGRSSPYKGVSWDKQSESWKAYIGAQPLLHLGRFEFQTEAALAYDAAASIRWGDFARLNFPRGNSSGRPTILFVGHGRAGKDEGAKFLARAAGLKYAGSFSWAGLPFVADRLRLHPAEAWETRHASREQWKSLLDGLRAHDQTLLAELVLATGEIAAGLRDRAELLAVKEAGLFSRIVWVDRDVPNDPTVTFTAQDCDESISNRGSLQEYHASLLKAAVRWGLLGAWGAPTTDIHRE